MPGNAPFANALQGNAPPLPQAFRMLCGKVDLPVRCLAARRLQARLLGIVRATAFVRDDVLDVPHVHFKPVDLGDQGYEALF